MKRSALPALGLAILILVGPRAASAQGSGVAVFSVGNGSALPGAADITVPVSLDSQDGAQVVAVNFDLGFDSASLEVGSVTIGSAASSAGKSLSFSLPAANRVRVIILGFNQTAIEDGPIAVVHFNVLATAAPGTSTLALSSVTASDADGQAVADESSDGSFTVLAPPVVDTPTRTATASRTPTRTPTASRTVTLTRTRTPTRTPTRTRTPSSTPSGDATATSAATRTPTRTRTPGPSATSAPPSNTPIATATGSLTLTTAPTPSGSPTQSAAAATATPIGTFPAEIETAAAATVIAMANLETAVVATVTALAPTPQPPPAGGTSDDLWWILLGGGAILGVSVLAGAGYLLWRHGQASNLGQ